MLRVMGLPLHVPAEHAKCNVLICNVLDIPATVPERVRKATLEASAGGA